VTQGDRRLARLVDEISDSAYGALVVAEARRAGLPVSLACALVEQESGFRNVFGHDRVRWPQIRGGRVTRARYVRYRALRRACGNQGVGVTQLTATAFQTRASRLGGCWKVTYQLRVGFEELARLIGKYGRYRGLASYNAGEAGWKNGRGYADQVESRMRRWHERLT